MNWENHKETTFFLLKFLANIKSHFDSVGKTLGSEFLL